MTFIITSLAIGIVILAIMLLISNNSDKTYIEDSVLDSNMKVEAKTAKKPIKQKSSKEVLGMTVKFDKGNGCCCHLFDQYPNHVLYITRTISEGVKVTVRFYTKDLQGIGNNVYNKAMSYTFTEDNKYYGTPEIQASWLRFSIVLQLDDYTSIKFDKFLKKNKHPSLACRVIIKGKTVGFSSDIEEGLYMYDLDYDALEYMVRNFNILSIKCVTD